MSNLVVVAEKGVVVLGSDSRFMLPDFSGIASDATRKIFPIADGAFIACSGRKLACDFQPKRAREIAAELQTSDIRAIGQRLERESLPVLEELVEQLKAMTNPDERTRAAICGDSLLHGCILIGSSDGRVGYVHTDYWVKDGEVTCRAEESFDNGPRKITFTSGAPATTLQAVAGGFYQDRGTWTDSPAIVTKRILAALRETSPVSGGPDQLVCLDADGARWIAEPPAELLAGEMASQTISASILMTSPSLQITSGAVVVTVNSFDFVKVTQSNISCSTQMQPSAFRVQALNDSLKYGVLTLQTLEVSGPNGTTRATVGADGNIYLVGGTNIGVFINGQRKLGPNSPNV